MNHKKYHFVFLSFLISILFYSITSAQSSYLDSLDGKFALQFQISSNFQLEDFQGTTFSGKYQIGFKEALRLGISVEAWMTNGEITKEYYSPDTTAIEEIDRNDFNLVIKFQYIRYFVANDDLSFYGGAGPLIGFNDRDDNRNSTIFESYQSFKIGLNILAGVEWSFNKNMTLSAEYGIVFSYIDYKSSGVGSSYNYSNKFDYFSINSDNVNFGISVYF